MPLKGESRSIFDLEGARGVNDSERLLSRLCKQSFLSLWAHSNLYNDSDMRGGKGSAKELCDVLVVFGNDVIVFSDKHVAFQRNKPLDIAWRRWYRRAIVESAKQLYGARGWLIRHPDRIFLDEQCTRHMPVHVPSAEQARYHLVAVTRGSFEACANYYPGSLGSLVIKSDLEGDEHFEWPFSVGIIDGSKPFVHVFDEFSLEALFSELDTVVDFIGYLNKRETLLSNLDRVVVSAGEEQLLAAYLVNLVDGEHEFLPKKHAESAVDLVMFDESHFGGLQKQAAYCRKKLADKPSYFWDSLIEKFINIGSPTLVLSEVQQSNHETEQALRVMASESRFRRRVLVQTVRGLMAAASNSPNKMRARMITSPQDPERVYIFLVVPRDSDESGEAYRKHRTTILHAYCRCCKLKFPEASTFIGIGFDHPVRDYEMVSEDLIVFNCPVLSDADREEAEEYRNKLGILKDDLLIHFEHANEFPSGSDLPRKYNAKQSNNNTLRAKLKSAKRKKLLSKLSRRRNRH